MNPSRFVALLRGINVGGNRVVKMSTLKGCFEQAGFTNVSTYIASGNVLFDAPSTARPALTRRVEDAIADELGGDASVVIRSRTEMTALVSRAPKGFGTKPALYRYDVIFLKSPLTAASALKAVTTTPGVDAVFAGTGVLYFSRLIAQATRSKLGKLVGQPAYKHMTIRNWNTTTKLAALITGA